MKTWWINLASREKILVSVGSSLLLIAVIYYTVVQPLTRNNADLITQIQSQQQLKSWMQTHVPKLLIAKQQKGPKQNSQQSLSTFVTKSLDTPPLASHQVEVQSAKADLVRLNMTDVIFNDFLTWAFNIWQQGAIKIKAIRIEKGSSEGFVNIQVSLVR